MNLDISCDLWTYLAQAQKPVVIFGTGNGADKIIDICFEYGIEICDVFASDGFARGQSFRGMTVLTYAQVKHKYGCENIIVLLCFATRLPEVIENIKRIATENEFYAPDVPVAGNKVFNFDFYNKYKTDIEAIYDMLSDDISKTAYRDIISYKLTGRIDYLLNCEHQRQEIFTSLLNPDKYRVYADLGAYTGDTLRELLEYTPELRYAIAFEPDKKTYRKLERYAESETRCEIAALRYAAWSEHKTLTFDCVGNKGSNVTRGNKTIEIEAESLDNVLRGYAADYIKYDVEGSEFEAILGSSQTIKKYTPDLCVSLYHRSEDIFILPMLIDSLTPNYTFYLRRGRYLPAWDINLIATTGT